MKFFDDPVNPIWRENWLGASGKSYPFTFYNVGARLPRSPGVYVFVSCPGLLGCRILYVGETNNLDGRVGTSLANHHRHDEAKKHGLAFVGVLLNSEGYAARAMIEKDLVCKYDPVCNRLPTPSLSGLAGLFSAR